MKLKASEILAACGTVLDAMRGDDAFVTGLGAAEDCGPGDLVFVDREEFARGPLEQGAAAVVTTSELAGACADSPITVLVARDVKLARALVMQRFFDRDLRPADEPRVHPTAVIHESATVAVSARLGARTVVGAGACIGEECVLLAGVVVENGAVIGDHSVIHPGVVVGFDCEIGRNVIIQAGTILGSEGFGFAQDEARRNHRIPQLGKVIVEDRVVIGAGCCIDRGTHGATRIGAGTVMDNLCHIAHNVDIGEDCILTAMLCVAGSTRIGKRVITSGQVGILDHLEIADDVALVHRAGVHHDVKTPGAYAGAPVQPLKAYLRNQATVRRISRLRDQVTQLEQRIDELAPLLPPATPASTEA